MLQNFCLWFVQIKVLLKAAAVLTLIYSSMFLWSSKLYSSKMGSIVYIKSRDQGIRSYYKTLMSTRLPSMSKVRLLYSTVSSFTILLPVS